MASEANRKEGEKMKGRFTISSFLFCVVISSFCYAQLSITDVGKYNILGVPTDQEGLSGITWAGGSRYYAVEDSGGRLHKLTINIDLSTGQIIGNPTDDSQVTLSGRTDLEGIAYIGNGEVYVSDETGATITKYNTSGGNSIGAVNVPDIYTAYRSNKSLESLTINPSKTIMWTANEEALNGTTNNEVNVDDGPEASSSTGTVVRLQKFVRNGDNWITSGQWAYETEAVQGLSGNRGVSDLCVLPSGQVLVLEREAYWNGSLWGDTIDFRNAIYLIDLADATDVSDITSLNGASYTTVSKELLWSKTFDNDMYEGICLGPQLNDGSYSLLLISDGDTIDPPLGDNQDVNESIYALEISGVIPEPTVLLSMIITIPVILSNHNRKKV